jgi:hypothetical protein
MDGKLLLPGIGFGKTSLDKDFPTFFQDQFALA